MYPQVDENTTYFFIFDESLSLQSIGSYSHSAHLIFIVVKRNIIMAAKILLEIKNNYPNFNSKTLKIILICEIQYKCKKIL